MSDNPKDQAGTCLRCGQSLCQVAAGISQVSMIEAPSEAL